MLLFVGLLFSLFVGFFYCFFCLFFDVESTKPENVKLIRMVFCIFLYHKPGACINSTPCPTSILVP